MIRVGTILHGYCGGEFSGEYGTSHECKRVEAMGMDWVIARELESQRVVFAHIAPESFESCTVPAVDEAVCRHE